MKQEVLKMIDVLIIGSGPAGLSAAIYARRANLNVTVLEKLYLGRLQRADRWITTSGCRG